MPSWDKSMQTSSSSSSAQLGNGPRVGSFANVTLVSRGDMASDSTPVSAGIPLNGCETIPLLSSVPAATLSTHAVHGRTTTRNNRNANGALLGSGFSNAGQSVSSSSAVSRVGSETVAPGVDLVSFERGVVDGARTVSATGLLEATANGEAPRPPPGTRAVFFFPHSFSFLLRTYFPFFFSYFIQTCTQKKNEIKQK